MANLAILGLQRNDIESALALREDGIATGEWGPDDESMIIRLQDSPDAITEAIAEQNSKLQKALPRQSPEEKAAKEKPAGSKPLKASGKKLGSGGRVRYSYPGEKGGDKQGKASGPSSEEEEDPQPKSKLAIPAAAPEQEPVEVPNGQKPPPDDPRPPDDTKHQQLQHSVNVGELQAALGISRDALMKIVARFTSNTGAHGGRSGFIEFMSVHLKNFIQEHGLEGDYFGLVYDVLTGARPEAVPQQQPAAQGKQ